MIHKQFWWSPNRVSLLILWDISSCKVIKIKYNQKLQYSHTNTHTHSTSSPILQCHLCRYPYGQPGSVPAVRYLNLLLAGHEQAGASLRVQDGLSEQYGVFHRLCTGHLLVQERAVGHSYVGPHWLCLCNTADTALHSYLPLPQRERGRHLTLKYFLSLLV